MHFYIHKPSPQNFDAILAATIGLPFTYPEIGISRSAPHMPDDFPRRYLQSHHRALLGRGERVFADARQAFHQWQMFDLEWLSLCHPQATPLEVGATLSILAKATGVWWFNSNRIIYTLDEREEGMDRFGFAYGTLSGNMISGEERFLLEWNRLNDAVYYDIYSFSRPNDLLARCGAYQLRQLQRRFVRESALRLSMAMVVDD